MENSANKYINKHKDVLVFSAKWLKNGGFLLWVDA